MSSDNGTCIYNKNHLLPLFYLTNRQVEERNLNIVIIKHENCLNIKIRDPSEYYFNYMERIDSSEFEAMKAEQSLDINFIEFKYNIIDMLQQVQEKKMFLKCEVTKDVCTLVFYGKSQIKSIIYLTIALNLTNQREILSELINNLQQIQENNDLLKRQITNYKKSASDKDQSIQDLKSSKEQLEQYFFSTLKQIQDIFKQKFKQTETMLLNKIDVFSRRLLKICNDISRIEEQFNGNMQQNSYLIKCLENLRSENAGNLRQINELKNKCDSLHAERVKVEQDILDWQKISEEKDNSIEELSKKNEEFKSDLEKATRIVSQKNSTIEELSQDLLQANQMLVTFNKNYDDKVRKLEELESNLLLKERSIDEYRTKLRDVRMEFERYRELHNEETHNRFHQELLLANNKIEELEGAIRKANKINALLTEKINSQKGFHM